MFSALRCYAFAHLLEACFCSVDGPYGNADKHRHRRFNTNVFITGGIGSKLQTRLRHCAMLIRVSWCL